MQRSAETLPGCKLFMNIKFNSRTATAYIGGNHRIGCRLVVREKLERL
jgi:hypothetical protein